VTQLKDALFTQNDLPGKLKMVHSFLTTYPMLYGEVFQMLSKWNYQDVAYYLSQLPLDRLSACGYDPWKLGQEINSQSLSGIIGCEVMKRVIPGHRYTSKEIKAILNDVYASLGITKNAVATDLANYVSCSSRKTGGKFVYVIN